MEGEHLLDLGHLTEVEQTIILNVLLRDAELRSKEEGRVRLVCLQSSTYFALLCTDINGVFIEILIALFQ